MTVIDSVLKMRNAPANRAIAAISAVVAWKSVVELRRAAARSCGEDSTYGCVLSRDSSRADTAAALAPAGQPDVDAGHAGLAEDLLRGGQRDDHRPAEGAGQRSVAADDADDPVGDAVAGALHRQR